MYQQLSTAHMLSSQREGPAPIDTTGAAQALDTAGDFAAPIAV
jgi:hypothetical protein